MNLTNFFAFLLLFSSLLQAQEQAEKKLDPLTAKDQLHPNSITILGGLSMPFGTFTEPFVYNIGAAQLGYEAGVEYRMTVSRTLSWLSSSIYAVNPASGDAYSDRIEGKHTSIWILTGAESGPGSPDKTSFRGSLLIGLFKGEVPVIYHLPGSESFRYTATGKYNLTIGYGVGFSILFPMHFGMHLRLLTANPRYTRTESWYNVGTKETGGRTLESSKLIVLFQCMLGWTF